ncbi:hypothetical protein C8R43DRAFT_1118071 [Mycena crocata]|nr:hypothetical protein C8R43DRAFT_1118071 [Mycena crocata]
MPPKPSNNLSLWTPPLRPFSEDEKLFSQEPFKCLFTERLHAKVTRRSVHSWGSVPAELQTLAWMEFASDFLTYCIGCEVVSEMPEEDLRQSWEVILNVLYTRFDSKGSAEGDAAARDLLLKEQMQQVHKGHFRNYAEDNIPAEFSWGEDIEEREAQSNDEDISRLENYTYIEQDMADDDDDPMDEDYIPEFVPTRPALRRQPVPSLPAPEPSASPSPAELPNQWCKHMKVFFYPMVAPKLRRSKKDLVDDYRAMRDLPKRVYQSAAFQTSLQESGLLDCMKEVCRAGNLLETSHDDVEASFRFHNWKVAYGEILCKWIEPIMSLAEYKARQPQSDPEFKFTEKDVLNLFTFMSAHPQMHPWAHNPMAAYFLESEHLFDFHSRTWLRPRLEALGYPSHRELMKRVRDEAWRPSSSAAANGESTPLTESIPTSPSSSVPLTGGQKRNLKRRKREDAEKLEKAGTEAQPGEGGCSRCRNRPSEERCVRVLEVFECPEAKKLIGAAMTCAAKGDRLKPLPPPKPKDGSQAHPRHIRYFNPEDKGFIWLKPRPETMQRCQQDITRLFWMKKDGSWEWVGGVRFNAMSKETLDQLLGNHRLVIIRALRRRADMQAWAYGTMTGTGLRSPMGGKVGDVFGPYACHEGKTPDDMRALYRHAVDVDVLVEFGTTIVPTMKKEIKLLTKRVDSNTLGAYALATFYCTNYISCNHSDEDVRPEDLDDAGGCRPCVSLQQEGTDKTRHEWDFAMTKFGVVIETHANTIWCFNGRHEHGSIIPSQSSIDKKAVSKGDHNTAKKTTAVRADKIRQIREGMGLRGV